jgi:amino acid transporter
LNISINTPQGFAAEDSIIVLVALYSISFAVSFLLCLSYIIIYSIRRDLEKFKLRAHRFMRFGIAPAAFTLYLGLVLGMKFSLHLGFTSLYIDNIAFVLSAYLLCLFMYSLETENNNTSRG